MKDVAAAMAPIASLWEATAERLRLRCQGMTDEELLWEPVPGCWNLRVDASNTSRWTFEYEFDPPKPHPVTTIGWRLVHITADNWIYWEHAFGQAVRSFPDLEVPHGAAAALQDWSDSRRPISQWLQSATERDLLGTRPSHLGAPKTAAEVIAILLDEQIHHGAEIALLRDLFVRMA